MGLSKNIDFEITLRNQSIKRRSLLRSMVMGLSRNRRSRECAESMKSKLPSDIKKKRKFEEEEHAAFTCSKKPPATVSKNEEFKCSDVDATRNQFRERLVEGLSKVYEENNEEMMKEQLGACDLVGVAASVESALFKTLGPITGSNRPQYRTILFSVRDSTNPDFRRKILLGEVKPESIPTMTDEEMSSHKVQEEIREIRERVLAKIPDSVDDDDDPYERLKADDRWLFYRSYLGLYVGLDREYEGDGGEYEVDGCRLVQFLVKFGCNEEKWGYRLAKWG
ncbi:hypothetical protein WN944_007194 [Citrus x changshan-huyou]|uniref:TFIIS central domain-containing protein n=1 Tax=Citrus x changshan-huyou TaxID=2935761 RepID=A0AAP0QTZ2_9ROSI